ncbi:hypothetical protein E2P81_ATG00627 [Venturia nashicola]|uniref:Uncharacterized protein n=1 Tax=Venturia nashicola TaxID=86259 RepID=A0A4Z1PXF0_9PEZI|nr:hypothetical protein E6O75_ATG00639 [Venturia nashicola]TLD39640.1 hypothetical protein E2P81_ATG00627 [Venturia nashicola]
MDHDGSHLSADRISPQMLATARSQLLVIIASRRKFNVVTWIHACQGDGKIEDRWASCEKRCNRQKVKLWTPRPVTQENMPSVKRSPKPSSDQPFEEEALS